jgi:hypothetical protein
VYGNQLQLQLLARSQPGGAVSNAAAAAADAKPSAAASSSSSSSSKAAWQAAEGVLLTTVDRLQQPFSDRDQHIPLLCGWRQLMCKHTAAVGFTERQVAAAAFALSENWQQRQQQQQQLQVVSGGGGVPAQMHCSGLLSKSL